MLSRKIQVLHDTIRKMLNLETDRNLRNILEKSLPADIAAVMQHFDPAAQEKILNLISNHGKLTAMLCEMDVGLLRELLPRLGVDFSVSVLTEMSPDDAADIIGKLPDDFREQVLHPMRAEESQDVEELIRYKPESAGGIMSTEVFALQEEMTVGEAIQAVQSAEDVETVFYPYVVNSSGILVGVLSLKKLLLNKPNTLIKQVMDPDPIRVRVHEDQEEVARAVARYNFLSLPVVDENNKLVGIVTVDDVLDVLRDEATEDFLQMSGAEKEAMEQDSSLKALRSRMPWLFVSLLGGVIASEVIFHFSSIFLTAAVLVGFIPVMLSLSGNVAQQSLTIVVRGLTIGQLSLARIGWLLLKEMRIVLVIGICNGLLLALFVFWRYDTGQTVPVIIGSTIAVAMTISVMIGALLPILLEKIGGGAAAATSPLVRTITDFLTIVLYFSLAALSLQSALS